MVEPDRSWPQDDLLGHVGDEVGHRTIGAGGIDPGETDPNNPDTDGDGLLDGIEDVAQLWLGEVALVRRVARDAGAVVAAGRRDRDSVVAQLALLLVDLWLVEVAIESAGRGDAGREVLDAFAA